MCGLGGPHSEGWPVGMWEMECTHFNKQVFFFFQVVFVSLISALLQA